MEICSASLQSINHILRILSLEIIKQKKQRQCYIYRDTNYSIMHKQTLETLIMLNMGRERTINLYNIGYIEKKMLSIKTEMFMS